MLSGDVQKGCGECLSFDNSRSSVELLKLPSSSMINNFNTTAVTVQRRNALFLTILTKGFQKHLILPLIVKGKSCYFIFVIKPNTNLFPKENITNSNIAISLE